MPEIIDGVTYPTTPGGRPYPTSGSPGKALWQLLQRAAEDLDEFDALLTGATSVLRRRFHKPGVQSVPGSTAARVTWTADTATGDPGEPAANVPGIRLAANGVVTVEVPGVYLVAVHAYLGSQYSWGLTLRANRVAVHRSSEYDQGSMHTYAQPLALAAGSTVEVWIRNNGGTANWPSGMSTEPANPDVGATIDTPPSASSGTRYGLSLTRLGAL